MKKIIFVTSSILLLGTIFIYIQKNYKEEDLQATYISEESFNKESDTSQLTSEEIADLIKKQMTQDPKILDTSITTYQNYSDVENGISFKYPSHYTFEQRPGYSIWGETSTSTIFSDPEGSLEMRPMIQITVVEKKLENQNLETLKNYIVKTYNDFLQERIKEGAPQEADGLINSSFRVFKNTWIELITKTYYVDVNYGNSYYYFYQKGDTIYQLHFFGLKREVVDEIMDSIRFI